MKVAINMDSSMGKMCLGKDVIEISSDQNKGSGDWDLLEYKDTTGSEGKKEPEPLVFTKCTLKRIVVVVNFEEETITIQPDFDPFLLSSDEEKNTNLDDLETLLDFDFDEGTQTVDRSPTTRMQNGQGK
ncbi:hypothetical protein Tco_0704496 [Tanacetum coccineum]|uniref:Uncharacterized protein n=1 Tax=Tanacetum coccineum TaxID=301880 RepID=A0ABQ4Y1S0_9ASTR